MAIFVSCLEWLLCWNAKTVRPAATSAATASTPTSARSRWIERRSSAVSRACRASSASRSASLAATLVGQVLALELGLRDPGLGGPGLEALELGAAHEQARVAVDVPPLARRRREPLVGAKVVPSGGDPVLEPGPPAEQRLVGDLDRRRFGAWVAVEREQPRGTERVDRQRQPALVDVEGVELGPLHTPAGVRRLAQRDQPQEQLPHGLAARRRPAPGRASRLDRRPRPRCRRSPRRPVRVSVEPSRRSCSSVSAYWRSGSAPGSSTTSATIRPSKPSSSAAPTRLAGPAIACSSSSSESGSTGSTRSRITSPKPRWRSGRS